MPEDTFNFFMPLLKVDKDKRTVSGYASTPALDLDGEIVSLDAVKKALPGYWQWRNIRRMHTQDAVGVGKEAHVDEKGLFLTAKIVDDDAWQKCLEGVYKGFSIGGRKLAKDGKTITEIELVEISVVDRPANPECRFEVQKSAKADAPAHLIPTRKRTPEARALVKMADAIKGLAKADSGGGDSESFGGNMIVSKASDSLCKEHSLAGCKDCTCSAHSKLDCAECVAKRDVKTPEREALASQGDANPDGSFPIKDRGDLENAISAFGRSKNKAETKALIIRRARELGATDAVPKKWAKKFAKKEAKAAKVAAEVAKAAASTSLTPPPEPSFLTLSGGSGAVAARGPRAESSHELGSPDAAATLLRKDDRAGAEAVPDLTERDRKLLKGMGVAGQLSYTFDALRSAQRALIREGELEGGDKKDQALASEVGSIAARLATVIGQKASHEAEEARTLTDADDKWLTQSLGEDFAMSANTNGDLGNVILNALKAAGAGDNPAKFLEAGKANMKKAGKARKEAEACIKAAHGQLKKAYLAKTAALTKAGKKPEDDEDADDMGKALALMAKAYSSLGTMKTFQKAAGQSFEKAAIGNGGTGPMDAGQFNTVFPGIKDLSMEDLTRAGPGGTERGSEPPLHSMEGEFPGKSASAAAIVKALEGAGYLSPASAELLVRATKAEAEAELLKTMPGVPLGGRRPATFDVGRLLGTEDKDLTKGLMAGVDPRGLVSDDEHTRVSSVGTLIGNMITGGHGKTIFDPGFHGTAGMGRA